MNRIGDDSSDRSEQNFEQLADRPTGGSLVSDFIQFLSHNKKWWLTPIVLALLGIGLLLVLSSSSIAPFIYTLF